MTTITREEVKAFIEQIESDLSNGWEAQIFELKLARIALASLEAEPEPVVPESISVRQAISALESADCVTTIGQAYKMGWNACRAAMLQGVEQPQNARQNIPENIPDGNSPAIPDDWVMVPKEPTQAMIKAWLSEVANFRGHAAGYKAALAAAPQREVK
ncbi:hypothetical protein NFE82_002892 [Salmonella enterica]|uniref:hypothetical protein n=1 Tax=Salmonella enterica TaxID=28901 RepID=UPI000B8E699F|nr:hypothetical protein [Salmonella enterica]EBD0462200.1 hypothetical protein [Salmonella enterica subsp. enterica]ECD5462178.1 hypothetical protein [Salmonella enterica subsp. enterica serovar Oranienburg]ECU8063397.1 hypothetical protein [Salmonella enterica subsp. enterica serovar O rough]EAM3888710.1 hypothetical protein [Salmonella enterica]EAP1789455.1 hypothetical protein [Salmonella enterica]